MSGAALFAGPFGLQITADTSIVVVSPYRAATARLGRRGSARLLLPAFGLVPFAGRDRELEELERWCLGTSDPALRLIIGAGGSGKTRLAAETSLRMAGHGWQAGFADPKAPPEQTKLDFDLPTLVVIDDADLRGPLIKDLAQRVSNWQDGDPTIRLILLARHAEGWWDALKHTEGYLGEIEDDPALELRDGELTRDERDEHHISAIRAFASALQRPPIRAGEIPRLPDDEAFANPLLVHMHALLTVCGAQLPTEGTDVREQILDGVLGREQEDHWKDFPGNGATGDQTRQQAVAVATLLSPRTRDETEEALRAIRDLDEAGSRDRAAARGAPNRKVIHDALDVLLRERLPALLTLAINDRDGPLPTALDLAIREAPQPHGAAGLLGELPKRATALAMLVADLTGQAVQAARDEAKHLNIRLAESLLSQSDWLAQVEQREEALAAIEEALRIYSNLNETHPGEFIPGLVKSLNSQSMRQADLGHREDALTTIEKAVGIVKPLADALPGEFQAELAAVLHTLSHRLAGLGRSGDALDAINAAVGIYRELAETDPDAFGAKLADVSRTQSVLASGGWPRKGA